MKNEPTELEIASKMSLAEFAEKYMNLNLKDSDKKFWGLVEKAENSSMVMHLLSKHIRMHEPVAQKKSIIKGLVEGKSVLIISNNPRKEIDDIKRMFSVELEETPHRFGALIKMLPKK